MYIPEKSEVIALFIEDMSYYGNKLYYFFFYPKLIKSNQSHKI